MSTYQRVKILVLLAAAVLIVLNLFSEISIFWTLILIFLYVLVVTLGVFNLSLGFFSPVKYHGDKNGKAVALTFDDGPIDGKTEKILKILADHQIQAAFFCIGSRVAENAELVKEIDKAGHLIGNHTFTHSSTIDFFPAHKIKRELTDTDEMIFEILQKKPRFFRPPYGITNPMIGRAVKDGKYLMVGWTLRSFDTIIKDPVKLFARAARSLKGGDIILFHDYSDSMISMLPRFLALAKEKGLKIVRLDELLNEKPYR
jgi:peptidoglycan-N-acetylglucosamine deacetylase